MSEVEISKRVSALVFEGANPTPKEAFAFEVYLRGGELRGDMAALAGQISKGKMREIILRPTAPDRFTP